MDRLKETPNTMVEALALLKKNGYTEDFNLCDSGIECPIISRKFLPHEFHIDFYYRFEGMNDPDDQSIVYAISDITGQYKGVLVDGYGPSSSLSPEMLAKLRG